MKKIFIYLSVFLLIGEAMIRFDESITPFVENRVVKISTDIELTPEYTMVKNDDFIFNDNDLRIMVIGDSYIHGGGINFEDNFSQQLKKMFEALESKSNKIWILDVSKSSSNNLDNNQTYFYFKDKFRPNIVILGYNLNDIEGELNKQNNEVSNINKFKQVKASGKETKSTIGKIYNIIQTSHLIHYIISKAHRKLNQYGIIIPNSKFDVNMKSYYQNEEIWQKSKILLREVIDDARKNEIKLIVYKFPEINLLEYPQLFSKANESIKVFFNKYPSVIYMDGGELFKGEESEKYILSKYDGHPNAKAHKKMATDVFNIIQSTNHEYNHLPE